VHVGFPGEDAAARKGMKSHYWAADGFVWLSSGEEPVGGWEEQLMAVGIVMERTRFRTDDAEGGGALHRRYRCMRGHSS